MSALSKNKIKLITSLTRKKFREEEGCFFAEGDKIVEDILFSGITVVSLIATKGWLKEKAHLANPRVELIEADEEELKKISQLKSTPRVIAVCKLPEYKLDLSKCSSELILMLDDIQDPGNMGTIIRLADWFGIETILASKGCADAFNPKVVQATMGAICRVKVFYGDLLPFIDTLNYLKTPIYGAFLEGENIYTQPLTTNGVIVMGNEGKGICKEVEAKIANKIHIPTFSAQESGSESLNVAIATSIICSEFRRRIFV